MKISPAYQHRVVSIMLLVGALAAGCSGATSAAPATQITSTDTPQPTTTEPTIEAAPTVSAMEEVEPGLLALTDISQLQSLFNADHGSPRLVLFLTSGCPSCLAGAEWINNSLLSPNWVRR